MYKSLLFIGTALVASTSYIQPCPAPLPAILVVSVASGIGAANLADKLGANGKRSTDKPKVRMPRAKFHDDKSCTLNYIPKEAMDTIRLYVESDAYKAFGIANGKINITSDNSIRMYDYPAAHKEAILELAQEVKNVKISF